MEGMGQEKANWRRELAAMGSLAVPFSEVKARFITQWSRAANPEWLAAKAGDGGCQFAPAPAHGCGERHAIKQAADRGLGSVEIPVGVQPDDRRHGSTEPGERAVEQCHRDEQDDEARQ